jgi:hypothetical protein
VKAPKHVPDSTVPARLPGPPRPLPQAVAMSISPPTGQHASFGTESSGTGNIQSVGWTPGQLCWGNLARISTRP